MKGIKLGGCEIPSRRGPVGCGSPVRRQPVANWILLGARRSLVDNGVVYEF